MEEAYLKNYNDVMDLQYQIKFGSNNERYNDILKFINKILKQTEIEISFLTQFKNISDRCFKDKDKLSKMIDKYGIPLCEKYNLKFNKKKDNVFKLLKQLVKIIGYKIKTKTFNGTKIYSIIYVD